MTPDQAAVGDQLRDNHPGRPGRSLTIVAIAHGADGKVTRVSARAARGRLVHIGIASLQAEGAARRRGFTLKARAPRDERLAAMLGREIQLCRDSRGRMSGPGSERLVRARLDRVDGHLVHATLLEDDPLATTAPHRVGESGCWHGLSFIDGYEAPAPEVAE